MTESNDIEIEPGSIVYARKSMFFCFLIPDDSNPSQVQSYIGHCENFVGIYLGEENLLYSCLRKKIRLPNQKADSFDEKCVPILTSSFGEPQILSVFLSDLTIICPKKFGDKLEAELLPR
jgi:hypothetical protein